MSVRALNEQALFHVEEDMTRDFKTVLASATPNLFAAHDPRNMQSPWLEIAFVVGRVNTRVSHVFPNGATCWNTWEGSQLEIKVATQRNINGNQHNAILGRARWLVQYYNLAQNWNPDSFHAVTEIREAGSIRTCDDENDLDFTTATFVVLHNIREACWPLPPMTNDFLFLPSGDPLFIPGANLLFA